MITLPQRRNRQLASEWTSYALSMWLGERVTKPIHSPDYQFLSKLGATSVVSWVLEKEGITEEQLFNVVCFHNSVTNSQHLQAWNSLQKDLKDHGIVCVPLKGIYMLSTAYSAMQSIRTMADIDALVSPEQLAESLDVLKEIGYEISDRAFLDAKNHAASEVGVIFKDGNSIVSIDLHRYPHNYPLFEEVSDYVLSTIDETNQHPSKIGAVIWLLTHKSKNGIVGDFKELYDYSVITADFDSNDWTELYNLVDKFGLKNSFHVLMLQEQFWFKCEHIKQKHCLIHKLGFISHTRLRLLKIVISNLPNNSILQTIPFFRSYYGPLVSIHSFKNAILSLFNMLAHRLRH